MRTVVNATRWARPMVDMLEGRRYRAALRTVPAATRRRTLPALLPIRAAGQSPPPTNRSRPVATPPPPNTASRRYTLCPCDYVARPLEHSGSSKPARANLADTDLEPAQALVHDATIALVQTARQRPGQPAAHPANDRHEPWPAGEEPLKGCSPKCTTLSMSDASKRLRHYAHEHGQRLTDAARAVVTITDPARPELITNQDPATKPPAHHK